MAWHARIVAHDAEERLIYSTSAPTTRPETTTVSGDHAFQPGPAASFLPRLALHLTPLTTATNSVRAARNSPTRLPCLTIPGKHVHLTEANRVNSRSLSAELGPRGDRGILRW